MKYSEYLATRKQDLLGNPAKLHELVEVEASILLFQDLKQAAHMARAVASASKGDPNVSVEEVVSIHALIGSYWRNGYNSLVAQGILVERKPEVVEPEPDPTPPPPPTGSTN